ncbi:MAG: DUF5329 family protein [Planctomycetota bacterium]|nr:DUF5329 family protein [Planctomycetota bacterium]
MTQKTFWLRVWFTVGLLFAQAALIQPVCGAEQPVSEEKKISLLIKALQVSPLSFVRAGKTYGGADAATHLTDKRKLAGARVTTAREFIAGCASKSELSGETYEVVNEQGKAMPLAEWLRAVLSGIELTLAETPPTAAAAAADTKPVAEMIKLLGSNSFDEREKSSRALAELGPAVLNDLAKAEAATEDVEVKQRCQLLREAINKPDRTALAALKAIENSDVTFVRKSERGMTGKQFASHLQAKAWINGFSLTDTADAFIEKIATRSILHGSEYRVRLPDGTMKSLKDWLNEQLNTREKR